MNDQSVQIEIPKSLFAKIEEHLCNTKFCSVSDYIVYATRMILDKEEQHDSGLSDMEKESIKKKLRDLGYIK
ncbi:CopG family transcriptional regulator [bacterium]|nr:CopG family transcriptional regulator [bacterium]